MTHLLDSSAFFAYFFDEPGGTRVRDVIEEEKNSIGLSVLTATEFWARLKSLDRDANFETEWEVHRPLFDALLEVDWRIAERAIAIRRATPARLPTIDSLIAATASVHDAVLVHRDTHMRAIPETLLRQLDLEAPASHP